MFTPPSVVQTFIEGDDVVLILGTYPGTPGRFLRYRQDPAWADITERDGRVRSHPVAWLAHNPASGPVLQQPAISGLPAE